MVDTVYQARRNPGGRSAPGAWLLAMVIRSCCGSANVRLTLNTFNAMTASRLRRLGTIILPVPGYPVADARTHPGCAGRRPRWLGAASLKAHPEQRGTARVLRCQPA